MREDWKHIRDEYQPSKRSEWIGAVIAAGFAGGIGMLVGMAICGTPL